MSLCLLSPFTLPDEWPAYTLDGREVLQLKSDNISVIRDGMLTYKVLLLDRSNHAQLFKSGICIERNS